MYASEENMFSAISVQAHLSLALNREKLDRFKFVLLTL